MGDGPQLPEISELAEKLLGGKANVSYAFLGFLSNDKVLAQYKDNPADVFLNLSSSEGIPVAVMEAMSFAIPVIATDVGGVSEIVNNENGILLSPNPDPEEVKQAIVKFCIMDEKTYVQYRKNAYQTWEEKYNAEKNYPAFVRDVLALADRN